jgi:hypothetical protein
MGGLLVLNFYCIGVTRTARVLTLIRGTEGSNAGSKNLQRVSPLGLQMRDREISRTRSILPGPTATIWKLSIASTARTRCRGSKSGSPQRRWRFLAARLMAHDECVPSPNACCRHLPGFGRFGSKALRKGGGPNLGDRHVTATGHASQSTLSIKRKCQGPLGGPFAFSATM